MCLVIPGQIVEFGADAAILATAEGDGVLRRIAFTMSRISEQEAQEQHNILAMLGSMDEAMDEGHGSAN